MVQGDQTWQSPQDWLEDDSTDPGYQLMTDAEIASEVLGEGCDSEISDNESNDDLQRERSVTPSQAFEAFGTALEWLESQADTDPLHLLLVKKWKDTAAQKRGELQKQTKLTSYFTLS